MTHEVEQMAYVGDTPWHGLGNELQAGQPLEVWARQAGMDWDILESPVHYSTGDSSGLDPMLSFPQHKVLFRSDSKTPLSVVGERYKVVQPREILEFYRDLTEKSGFELETAGVLKGGRKLWALAKTGQQGTLSGDDRTEGYVLLATACDGSLATTAQFTSVRVVCNNTLAVSLDNARTAVKVRHSTTFDAAEMKKRLGISVSAWDEFMYRLKTLSERRVQHAEAERFLRTVFAEPASREHPDAPRVNERAAARTQALFDGDGRGAELPSSRHTAYGLLNAVTEFVDHERRARSADYRLDSAWFGQGAALKQKALEQATALVA